MIVVSGGTSDLPVAAEAQLALQWHGIAVSACSMWASRAYTACWGNSIACANPGADACAGMEGALPTVLLASPQPVIGVPVSVGYGQCRQPGGLHGMLASCAPGIAW